MTYRHWGHPLLLGAIWAPYVAGQKTPGRLTAICLIFCCFVLLVLL